MLLHLISLWETERNWISQAGQKTNLEMEVYRQALSALVEQRQQPEFTNCMFVLSTNVVQIGGSVPAVIHPNMHKFIIKINAGFPGQTSSCLLGIRWSLVKKEYEPDSEQKSSRQGTRTLSLSCLWTGVAQRQESSLMDNMKV